MINWPDLMLPPINLWSLGADHLYYKRENMEDFNYQVHQVKNWHIERNLIEGSTDQAQYVKLIEEAGELAGNIARGKDVRDDIGDMLVVLINIATRNGCTLQECLSVAWSDIKDRKGKMVDGVFIKQEDLSHEHSTHSDNTNNGS